MVEVFRTNIKSEQTARTLTAELMQLFHFRDVHFDLEDEDKILRIEANEIQNEKIISFISGSGFKCEVLPD